MYFRYFLINSLGKRLNPDHLMMLCATFGWNKHSGSGEAGLKFTLNTRTFKVLSKVTGSAYTAWSLDKLGQIKVLLPVNEFIIITNKF